MVGRSLVRNNSDKVGGHFSLDSLTVMADFMVCHFVEIDVVPRVAVFRRRGLISLRPIT